MLDTVQLDLIIAQSAHPFNQNPPLELDVSFCYSAASNRKIVL